MKWIFALLFIIPSLLFAVESVPASSKPVFSDTGLCKNENGEVTLPGITTKSSCSSDVLYRCKSQYPSSGCALFQVDYSNYIYFKVTLNINGAIGVLFDANRYYASVVNGYYCPPSGQPEYTVGPVAVNGSQVCQKPPKVCMMGAIVRVDKDGKETCVANCSSAAGMIRTSQFFYQAGPDIGSTAGQVQCYGQCAVQTSGGYTQLSSGAYTGTFAFTGANCPVVRPEPTVDSESNTSSNGSAIPVDESNTSQGTSNALGQLNGAASAATGTQVQPSVTGPDGTSTLKDVTKTIADAANAQIKATSAQNVATGNLISNTNKDLQNTIIKTMGGSGAATLQAQGNGKLDGIGSAIGAGNGKLDGIQSTLEDIADKLDEPGEETPFVPGAGSGPFWESVLPESSFTDIKDKQAESIQEIKDLATEFQSSIQMTDLAASGAPDEWSLNMYGTTLSFGMGAFQMILDMGLATIILFLCALYAVYIIANRK